MKRHQLINIEDISIAQQLLNIDTTLAIDIKGMIFKYSNEVTFT